ncbi:hypothetical protein SCYAM73S_07744 [Streptomyces cyaneofuscatus]
MWYGALRQAAVLLPRPDERVRTALSDPSRIGVVASGVSAALAGGGNAVGTECPTPRAAGLPRTTGWTGFSCCGPRHCHTYQAVGYGTVATAVRALLPHPPGDSPMPSTPDVIDEPGPSVRARADLRTCSHFVARREDGLGFPAVVWSAGHRDPVHGGTMTAEPTTTRSSRWPVPPQDGYTVDDLFTLPDLPPHTELIDGSLVFVSPQRKFHSTAIDLLGGRAAQHSTAGGEDPSGDDRGAGPAQRTGARRLRHSQRGRHPGDGADVVRRRRRPPRRGSRLPLLRGARP